MFGKLSLFGLVLFSTPLKRHKQNVCVCAHLPASVYSQVRRQLEEIGSFLFMDSGDQIQVGYQFWVFLAFDLKGEPKASWFHFST